MWRARRHLIEPNPRYGDSGEFFITSRACKRLHHFPVRIATEGISCDFFHAELHRYSIALATIAAVTKSIEVVAWPL